jgi:hypothetical protein
VRKKGKKKKMGHPLLKSPWGRPGTNLQVNVPSLEVSSGREFLEFVGNKFCAGLLAAEYQHKVLSMKFFPPD